ncbi:hypothetical protein D3C71_1700610 [compost metagenome]
MVLAVGARLSGQASCATLPSRCTSANRASSDCGLPVIATSLAPMRRATGRMVSNSWPAPEYDRAITTSSFVIMPRSPCTASAACTKKAGVPVEANVAAILRAMCPVLPMPVTTTRPRQASSMATTWVNESSSRADRSSRPWLSTCNVLRADASAASDDVMG